MGAVRGREEGEVSTVRVMGGGGKWGGPRGPR